MSRPAVGPEELEAVKEVLDSGWLAYHKGGKVDEFEERIARYLGIDHAVAVNSCTSALHLALLSLHNRPKSVICPDFTFPATGNAIELAGARPILVDVSLTDYNISPDEVRKMIQEHSVIMPVHLFGCPCEMDSLCELAEKHRATIIEDAAPALGAKYRSRKVGTFGEVACFSFHATKGVTTGEGGVLVTNDGKIAERAKVLRDHGRSKDKVFIEHGYNYRMTELQAAIGIVQLKKIDKIIAERQKIAKYYAVKLKDAEGIQVPAERKGHAWQRYVVMVRGGNQSIIKRMALKGIECAVGTWCLSEQPAFKEWRGLNPNSKLLYGQTLALPAYHGLKLEEQDYVTDQARDITSHTP